MHTPSGNKRAFVRVWKPWQALIALTCLSWGILAPGPVVGTGAFKVKPQPIDRFPGLTGSLPLHRELAGGSDLLVKPAAISSLPRLCDRALAGSCQLRYCTWFPILRKQSVLLHPHNLGLWALRLMGSGELRFRYGSWVGLRGLWFCIFFLSLYCLLAFERCCNVCFLVWNFSKELVWKEIDFIW